ncbi:hypothetical protein H072_6342 [Dactylellina haptotyla CBS 200.50]|uniref:F-box domain-containing protein n=1 Tax=Dactylellina haptotyla (strain CBS 200.50) TaxID=1284197 RepID=S8BXB8_DACHA|nr:hypothetical protein H072_6342 [Dactylellina haptotyla CBS 200.50]
MSSYEIRHVAPEVPIVATLPKRIIAQILSYLPLQSLVGACKLHENILRLVCEDNRQAYFGYRKHIAKVNMPAIIFSTYPLLPDETLKEHASGAKELADMICEELGRNR